VSQANKQLVLEALHALDRGNADAFAELHHPDYVNHEAAAGRQRGPQGARATAAFLHGTFADLRHEPLDAVAEGDLVVIRGQASGRHIAEIDGFPATGRTFSVQHIHIFRVTDGKISEHWCWRTSRMVMAASSWVVTGLRVTTERHNDISRNAGWPPLPGTRRGDGAGGGAVKVAALAFPRFAR
jgi:predicted ester cyclase